MVLTKIHLPPQSQAPLECHLAKYSFQHNSCSELVFLGDRTEDKCSFGFTRLSTIDDDSKVLSAMNLSDNQIMPTNHRVIRYFEFLSKAHTDNLIENDRHLISSSKISNPFDFDGEFNQLIGNFHFEKIDTPASRHLCFTRSSGFQIQKKAMIFPT